MSVKQKEEDQALLILFLILLDPTLLLSAGLEELKKVITTKK